MNTRFRWLKLPVLLCSLALLVMTHGAQAQQKWPNRPVYINVGWSAGGTTDILARILGQKLSDALGVPVIIKNGPGAAGGVEAALLAKAALDDHVFMMIPPSVLCTNQFLYKTLGYNPEKDFIAVGLVAQIPNALAIHSTGNYDFKTFKEFVDYVKANPGKINYASAGTGTTGHMLTELMKTRLGLDIKHIPYRGNGPALQALLSKNVDLNTDNNAQLLDYIRSGTLRALAVSSAKRWPQLPNVPTFAELGYPEMTTQVWYGLSAKSNMPKEIVQRMNAEINKILSDPDMIKRLNQMNLEPTPGTPEAMETLIREDRVRWKKVIEDAKIPAN